MTGKVITTSLNKAKQVKADTFWLITRGGSTIQGMARHAELSPSSELYARYVKEWKGTDPEHWWSEYERIFEQELQTIEKQRGIDAVERLVKDGQTVALVCFCSRAEHCHRRLVGRHMMKRGLMVEEAGAKRADEEMQLTFFDAVSQTGGISK